jgi:hypothetical protein
MAEDNQSIYILAIVCIMAIVIITYFVSNYVAEHPISSESQDTVGQVYASAESNVVPGHSPVKRYIVSEPCAYAYIRDDSKCQKKI